MVNSYFNHKHGFSINNGLLTERALRDVFEITSYIDIGTEDDPLPYPVKPPRPSQLSGKQFMTNPAKWGSGTCRADQIIFQTNDTVFENAHPWICDGDPYFSATRYIESGQDKKLGFWTSDFSKRDEFSNTLRTNQYREQLLLEEKHAKKTIELDEKRLKEQGIHYNLERVTTRFDGPKYLYDIGRAGLATTEHCYRCHKQKYYCPHRGAYSTNNPYLMKESGWGYKTAYEEYGRGTDTYNYAKPAHARKPIVKDTFYRRGNAFFARKTPSGFIA